MERKLGKLSQVSLRSPCRGVVGSRGGSPVTDPHALIQSPEEDILNSTSLMSLAPTQRRTDGQSRRLSLLGVKKGILSLVNTSGPSDPIPNFYTPEGHLRLGPILRARSSLTAISNGFLGSLRVAKPNDHFT